MEKGDRMFLGEVHLTDGRRIQWIHNAVEVEITNPREEYYHPIGVAYIGAKGNKVGKAVRKYGEHLYKTKEEALKGVQAQIDEIEEGFNLEIKKARDNTNK